MAKPSKLWIGDEESTCLNKRFLNGEGEDIVERERVDGVGEEVEDDIIIGERFESWKGGGLGIGGNTGAQRTAENIERQEIGASQLNLTNKNTLHVQSTVL